MGIWWNYREHSIVRFLKSNPSELFFSSKFQLKPLNILEKLLKKRICPTLFDFQSFLKKILEKLSMKSVRFRQKRETIFQWFVGKMRRKWKFEDVRTTPISNLLVFFFIPSRRNVSNSWVWFLELTFASQILIFSHSFKKKIWIL